jgi:Protein of unknown function with PCYCGC motif
MKRTSFSILFGVIVASCFVAIASFIQCPALSEGVPAAVPEVISPEKIPFHARAGYAAAQKTSEICAKLFCYCGCDETDSHRSLLDCFTSDHGIDCSICQDEAIVALKMKNNGKSLADIQRAIDTRFLREYHLLFQTPTKGLLRYREERLWHPITPEELPSDSRTAGKSSNGAVLKPGCCGHKRL